MSSSDIGSIGAAQVRNFRTCAALVLVGCTGGKDADTGIEPTTRPPAMTSASAECATVDALWRFDVRTDAWTGNGQVLLSTDGVYVERHPLYSRSAEADGTSDTLDLTLSIVPDWHDVVLGSSTVFNCGEADLTGILRVFTRDGAEEADCRAFGVAPERWATWSAGASCAEVLETD
ncbi:MAG: hypothetical protein V4850_06660 [Myxococcota bacterium]